MKKKVSIIIIGITILLVSCSYQDKIDNKNTDPTISPQKTNQPELVVNESQKMKQHLTFDENSGINTFINEIGGYSFKYPQTWNASINKYNNKNSLFGIVATSEFGDGGVEVNSYSETIEEYIDYTEKDTGVKYLSRENININGVPGIRSKYEGGAIDGHSVILKKDNQIFNIFINSRENKDVQPFFTLAETFVFDNGFGFNNTDQEESKKLLSKINEYISDNNYNIEEIDNPNLLELPGIYSGQIKKYFKLNDILFALALRRSMNIGLEELPIDWDTYFTGVLVAESGDDTWSRFIEIKDAENGVGNNPYYLAIEDKKLILTVVDTNGGGSGEGNLKVFALSKTGDWELKKCNYFGLGFDQQPNRDYLAFSINYTYQKPQPIENCNNVQLIYN